MPIYSFSSIRTRNTEQCTPFLIWAKHISDNLVLLEITSSIKHFDLFAFIRDVDMIDWTGSDDTKNVRVDPSPEHDVFSKLNMLKFAFWVQVENLEDVASRFIRSLKWNDVLVNMHDGAINLASWSSDNVHFVGQFNDANLRSSLSILISNTDIFFWLESSYTKLKAARIDS